MDFQLLISTASLAQLLLMMAVNSGSHTRSITNACNWWLVIFGTILGTKVLVIVTVVLESVVLLALGTRKLIPVHIRHPSVLVAEPAVDAGFKLASAEE